VTPPDDVRFQADAHLEPNEVNAAYAWVEWPERDEWRIEAAGRTSTWFTARDLDGALVGICRLLDDGGLHASVWDVIVRPDRQRLGIGRELVRMALERAEDRRLVVLVSTPAALPLFESLGFTGESHGHRALYLRPGGRPHSAHEAH
jgi:ribosomal protein S18 acetylase RimI-like enzyme